MGNIFLKYCRSKKDVEKSDENLTRTKSKSDSKRNNSREEESLHRQALAMAIQQHNQQSSHRSDNASMSRRNRSTSSRGRPTDSPNPLLNTKKHQKQLSSEDLEKIKTKKFVLVHGEGFGAWCWYKTISLLEESGLFVIALDLTGSGIDTTDSNNVTTLADYTKPLIDFLNNLPDDEQVILVGHSGGGACVSYALEHLPHKISKSVYLCATMISDGQRTFDVFAQDLAELFSPESKSLIYGNGKDKPPTGLMLEKDIMRGLYFNQSPTKDIALAMVSMRLIPLGPMMEKLCLSAPKYGSGTRFYIQTLNDHALSHDVQEKLVRENPPQRVFQIKGSDHCPFFSKPQSLHKILIEIAQIS